MRFGLGFAEGEGLRLGARSLATLGHIDPTRMALVGVRIGVEVGFRVRARARGAGLGLGQGKG